ncbi:MAG: glycosyltransferase [Halopseudomonas sp.]
MRLFVSIVSHGHEELIADNHPLQQLAAIDGVEVVVRDNQGSARLQEQARVDGYHYQVSTSPLGFGANNNAVFKYCGSALEMRSEDYFCLLNPDLLVNPDTLMAVVNEVEQRQARMATINLYQDRDFTRADLNIKRFPSLLDFAQGFLCGANPAAYDKLDIAEPLEVDWASGAFLLFRADLYQQLGGFDGRFFMYLEDVDICRRARDQFGERLLYLPQFNAVHLCQQANKGVFSKHFLWFLSSMFKYFFKHGWKKPLDGAVQTVPKN